MVVLVACGGSIFGDTIILNSKPSTLQSALQAGGTVTFAIDGTITLTNTITITNDVVLDGDGHDITISGNNKYRIFTVTNAPNNHTITVGLANLSIIDGKGTNGGGIRVERGNTLNVTDVTFSGNHITNSTAANGASGDPGGNAVSGASGNGGAIYNLGFLNIDQSFFTNNFVAGGKGGNGGNGDNGSIFGGDGGNGGNGGSAFGGAIFNSGTNTIIDSAFTLNQCTSGDGGSGGTGGSGSINGNTGQGGTGGNGAGGGIYNSGRLYVTNCTFADNLVFGGNSAAAELFNDGTSANGITGGAASGGAIYNLNSLTNIENSTFFKNLCQGGGGGNTLGDASVNAGNGGAGSGGALFSGTGKATIINCTFATNDVAGGTNGTSTVSGNNGAMGAASGGNIYRSSGTVLLQNSILAQGEGTNASGTITDGGYNLSSDASCHFTTNFFSVNNTDPMLDSALTNAGVFTQVFALLADSPAIDRIPSLTDGDGNITNFPATDQRGVVRPAGIYADIGAYEFESFSISGRITQDSTPVTNLIVNVSDGSVAITDTNGNYVIVGLLPGTYTVTPSGTSDFTPINQQITVGPDADGVNFTSNSVPQISKQSVGFNTNNNGTFLFQVTTSPNQTFHIRSTTNFLKTNTIWQISPTAYTNPPSGIGTIVFTNRFDTNAAGQSFFEVFSP